jgi:hypothetical protein
MNSLLFAGNKKHIMKQPSFKTVLLIEVRSYFAGSGYSSGIFVPDPSLAIYVCWHMKKNLSISDNYLAK